MEKLTYFLTGSVLVAFTGRGTIELILWQFQVRWICIHQLTNHTVQAQHLLYTIQCRKPALIFFVIYTIAGATMERLRTDECQHCYAILMIGNFVLFRLWCVQIFDISFLTISYDYTLTYMYLYTTALRYIRSILFELRIQYNPSPGCQT